MTKIEAYQSELNLLTDWDDYLLRESGLPGPRGNIELAQAVANLGNYTLFLRYLSYNAEIAPVNSPYEFLAFCGTLGLGKLLAGGQGELLQPLRKLASDPRWRIREAVAMALQRLGEVNMPALISAMCHWSLGTPLEQRAAAAALCEPRLLAEPAHVRQVLEILDAITASIASVADRRDKDFLALRKGLGYCWSVAVVALPVEGKALLEKWLVSKDRDIRWIMQENLKKTRLVRLDASWVERWQARR
ncbi:MAG: HEAT repeat domain-containing protein [Acidobacteriaceae bacterium]